jgi:hypothetical protein
MLWINFWPDSWGIHYGKLFQNGPMTLIVFSFGRYYFLRINEQNSRNAILRIATSKLKDYNSTNSFLFAAKISVRKMHLFLEVFPGESTSTNWNYQYIDKLECFKILRK